MKIFFFFLLASLAACVDTGIRICGFYTSDGGTVRGCFERNGRHYSFEGGFQEEKK